MELQDFYDGKVFEAYDYFGAHLEKNGVMFRTYAPNASKITVIGEFNNWTEEVMEPLYQSGIYSFFSKNAKSGMTYQYCIYGSDGKGTQHCDPYGFGMELRPGECSYIVDLSEYKFDDEKWMNSRTLNYDKPLNIYELHLGSWHTNPNDANGWVQYDEIAEELISYLKENHYTHVEFMPLTEHPFDGSWGYQITGFFSPTSRYGTAKQLMKLIDQLHQAGLGAIMDFVPVHFAVDDYGLKLYDTTALYEYPNKDVGASEWGTCNFIHSRFEVCCFLQSAAHYWLKEYHFDGLRMDAISRVIYWQGDPKRGVNENAVKFLKTMNLGLHNLFPTAMLIAEDSTSYPNVTQPVEEGGLGFDYKWDLGWMHDTLDYFENKPANRSKLYHKLTFSMMYFYNERYILPLSHDEVVHGKKAIIDKMYGEYEDKFRQAKALYLYMMVHPGKKLNFMGNEIAQFREWDEKKEQDWDLLKYPTHDSFHQFMIKLNDLYVNQQAFYEKDFDKAGFEWVDCHQDDQCIYVLKRSSGSQTCVVVFNYSDKEVEYALKLESGTKLEVQLHSDWECYGGKTKKSEENEALQADTKGNILIKIPYYSGSVYRII